MEDPAQPQLTRKGGLYSQILGQLRTAARVAWIPWRTFAGPLDALLNEEGSEAEKNIDTMQWQSMKVSELTAVMVTGALVAATVTGALAWNFTPTPPWTVKAAWLCSLLQALFSVVVAMQQNVGLARIGSHKKGLTKIREVFRDKSVIEGGKTKYYPSNSKLFALQISTMLLGTGLAFFFFGLMIVVYDAAQSAGSWGDEVKIAICFTIALIYSFVAYMWSWRQIEWNLQEASESVRD